MYKDTVLFVGTKTPIAQALFIGNMSDAAIFEAQLQDGTTKTIYLQSNQIAVLQDNITKRAIKFWHTGFNAFDGLTVREEIDMTTEEATNFSDYEKYSHYPVEVRDRYKFYVETMSESPDLSAFYG